MASPYIARESVIVGMATALRHIECLDNIDARFEAYRAARTSMTFILAFDEEAHRRQIVRRQLLAKARPANG